MSEEEKEEVFIPPVYKVVTYRLSQRHRIEEWVYVAYPGGSKKNPIHPDIMKNMFVGFTTFGPGVELQFGLTGPNIHAAAMAFEEAEQRAVADAEEKAKEPKIEIVK